MKYRKNIIKKKKYFKFYIQNFRIKNIKEYDLSVIVGNKQLLFQCLFFKKCRKIYKCLLKF